MKGGLDYYGVGPRFVKKTLLPFLFVASFGMAFMSWIQSTSGGLFLSKFNLTQALVLAAFSSFPSQDLAPLFVGDGGDALQLVKSQAAIYILIGLTCLVLALYGRASRLTVVFSLTGAWFTGVLGQWLLGMQL